MPPVRKPLAQDDDTVILRRPPRQAPAPGPAPGQPAPAGQRGLLLAGGLMALAGVAALAWFTLRQMAVTAIPTAPPPVALIAPPAQQPPLPPLATEADILVQQSSVPTVRRLAANPRVWVLDFPSLEQQGQALNRAAALVEKASTPRDRALADAELAAAIAADRRTSATWYSGHDYRLADLERLFRLMDQAGIRATAEEDWLKGLLPQARATAGAEEIAFISIPGLDQRITAPLRAAILRHELSHGEFLTRPALAAHMLRAWHGSLTAADRSDLRRFLASEGYDPTQDALMANEAMAYLLHTPDPALFDPGKDLGWDAGRTERVRRALRQDMP